LIWVVPLVALLHPAPWFVGAAVVLVFRTFRGDIAGPWSWFFGALFISLLLMLLSTLVFIARWRRR
jgi:hypothetical protein